MSMGTPLNGQVAIVTGAGQGIGRAIAERLASAGASLAVVDRALESATEVADDLASRFGGVVRAYACDVRDRSGLEGVAREVEGILVVESAEGEVVGYITTWQDVDGGIGYIPNLAFVPEWRGRGLGRLLIQMALDRFREAGLSHAKIETLAQNEVGHHLYTSIGFREVARQVHFFADLSKSQSAQDTSESD